MSESSTLIRYKTIFIIHLIINRMRKFTLLLTLLMAFMTTAIAQIDTSKEYRVKHTTTGKVMNASNYDAHPTGPLGGVNFVEEAESDDQVFLFEADGSGYKLKTKSGKYIYCQAWNVDALDQASTLTFSNNGDGTYKIGCDKGYFKVENVTGSPVVKENGAEVTKEQVSGDFPFCDAGFTAAANFELVEVEAGTPEVPEVPEVGGEDEATLAAIEKAEGALAKTGVGYPAAESASRAALVAAVEEAKAAPTTENGTKVNAALVAYMAETNVTLPETGKAYTFTMVAKNGNKFYLNYTGQDVAMVAATGEALPESAQFVATANGDGTYTFQTNDGNYLVYHSKYAGVSWLQGASTIGFQAEKDDMTNITLAKLSKGNNVAATDEQVFGLVSWYSMRGVRSDNNANEMGYMVLKADGSDYDGATAPFWNDNYSSAFLVEEVEVTTPETPEVPNAELAETYTGTCNINFMGAPTEANVSLDFDKDSEGNAKAGYAYLLFSNVELGPVFNAEVPYEVKGNTVVLKGIEVATEEKSEDTKEVDLTFTVQEDGKLLSNDQVYGPGFLSSILFDFSQCPLAPKSEVVEPEQPEQPEVPAGPVVITDVAQLSNAKCYTLVSSDTGRGGMYTLADKVDMCGVTYNAGTDACHSVALDNADPKQQFAFVEYEGKLYLYSVSEKKFVMKSGDTNALVGEAPFEHVVVEKVGENTFALQANGTHYFTASPGWCANPERGTCIQSTLDSHSSDNGWDNGAWYTITEVADFDATEALAMLAPATETPEALKLVSVDPADGSELESVNKFTFTFNKPVTIGEEGGVTLSANGGTTTLEVIASDEETSVVTFTTGKEITVSGDYELKVAAGTFVDADGNTNEAMTFKYKVVSTANTLTLVSTNPSTDEVQTSLKRITLTFSEKVIYFDDVTINVTDEGGNVVTTGIIDYGLNYEDMDVVLNDAITTPGKYTVTIPENCMFGYVNYNPEIVLTYTIGSEEPEVPEVPYNTFVPTKITPAEGLVESLKEIVLDFGPNDYPGTNGLDMNSTFNLTNAAGDVVATGKLSYSGWTAAAVTLDKEIVEPGVYSIIIPEGSIWNSKVSGTADKGVSNGARCNPTLELTYEIKAGTSVVAVDPACGHYEVMPATIKVTFSQEISAITFSRVRTDVANDAYTLQATDMTINGKELTFTVPAEYVTEARNMLIMLSVVDANGNSVSYASNKETEIEGYVMLEYTADGITGINGITVEQLKDIYTLDGRKVVLTPGQKIKKGLYIIGGKKVYVK